jgi:hypothetical protein
MDLYLPACNNITDTAHGILTGFPMPVQYFNNRRFLVYLNERIYTLLQPFLPTIMQDYLTYPNLIGLRSGKFTTSAPTHHSNTVTYVAASDIDRFNNLLAAQTQYFQTSKCQHFQMFGITFRITPLPNSSPKGIEIRQKLHDTCDLLFNTFTDYRKVLIPYAYFTTPVTDDVITQIVSAKHVKACIPYFRDETNPDPDHYVLFLTNHTQFLYTTANNLYDVMPDLPAGLIVAPKQPDPHNDASTGTPSTNSYDPNYDDDIAFLQLLTNTDSPPSKPSTIDSTDSITTTDDPMITATTPADIPNHISTMKRPHHPTGETIAPDIRRSKPTQTSPTHPPRTTEDMIIDTPNPKHTHLPSESISDSAYMFDPTHSQDTRLEIMDALGIAKTISHQHYEQTYNYIATTKHIDIDHVKQLATQPLDAHNDSHASPHNNHV